MLRHPALRTLTFAIVLACGIGTTARPDALVGQTQHLPRARTVAPAPEQFKATYRRPDTIPFPPKNPYTPAKALLGRVLYYDTRLSGAGTLACASCHNPGLGYGDGLAKSMGDDMKPLDRRSPTIINSAWGKLFMWDGRAASLEEQALGPIEAPREMNQSLDRLVRTLSNIPGYRSLFAGAFPDQPISPATIGAAVATYERTIVSSDAPFDAWIDGDGSAIPDAARRGFDLFNTKAKCALCHGGWNFTDDGFHDIGLPDADTGRGQLLPHVRKMQHAFKTPSLREIARRAPYMHDGSLPTLAAVVVHYDRGGVDRASKSELITPLDLSAAEQADLVAFLMTLTSADAPGVVPVLPR